MPINCKLLFLLLISLFASALQADTLLSVTDDLGREVRLDKPATRLIALSPHLAELAFAAGAGDKLVATVRYADYPEAAIKLPRVGGFNSWDLEEIVSYKPDLVLVWFSAGGDALIKKLTQLGIPVYVSEPRKLTDISRSIRDIGQLVANASKAEKAADKLDQGFVNLTAKYRASDKVSVYYQVWDKPMITINGQQLISEILSLCGAVNVFAELSTLAPVISTEALIKANPQVMVGGRKPAESQSWLENWQRWPAIDAVKNDRLFFIDPDLLNRQTARMLQGAAELCQQLDKAR